MMTLHVWLNYVCMLHVCTFVVNVAELENDFRNTENIVLNEV